MIRNFMIWLRSFRKTFAETKKLTRYDSLQQEIYRLGRQRSDIADQMRAIQGQIEKLP